MHHQLMLHSTTIFPFLAYGSSLIFIEEEEAVVVLLFILHVDVHAPVVVVRGAVVGGDRAADRQDDPWRR